MSRYLIKRSLGESCVDGHEYRQCKNIKGRDGTNWLMSYNTLICGTLPDGTFVRCCGAGCFSVTTRNHLYSWMREYDVSIYDTVSADAWHVFRLGSLTSPEVWELITYINPDVYGVNEWEHSQSALRR
jgi:hypothetical protein